MKENRRWQHPPQGLYPAKIQKPVYQLPEEVERRLTVTSDNDLWWETAKACQTRERVATVNKMVLTNSIRNGRQSFPNSAPRYTLFTFSSAANKRVPSKNCSATMGAKHERLGSKYASHFATTGRLELTSTFCSKK